MCGTLVPSICLVSVLSCPVLVCVCLSAHCLHLAYIIHHIHYITCVAAAFSIKPTPRSTTFWSPSWKLCGLTRCSWRICVCMYVMGCMCVPICFIINIEWHFFFFFSRQKTWTPCRGCEREERVRSNPCCVTTATTFFFLYSPSLTAVACFPSVGNFSSCF